MTEGAELRDLVARISMEAERLAGAGRGPSSLVEAVMREGASDLAALAAERHHHAAMVRLEEDHRAMLAERSPVFRVDDRTLIAAPVGRLEREGFARFIDRILAEIAFRKPEKIVLVMQGFEDHGEAAEQLAAFEEELAALGVGSQRR